LGAGETAAQAPALEARKDVQVSIRHVGAAEGGIVREVELAGEAASEGAARDYGFRSMRQVVDVDCTSRRERVVQMQAFSAHGQRGETQARRLTGQWAQPSADAYLADVVSVICRSGPPRETAPSRQLASIAPARPRAPAPAAPVERPPPVLAAADPPPHATAVRPPAVRPAVALRTPQQPAAAPMAAMAIVSGPLAPLPAPASAASRARTWVAQVGAGPSPDAARQALGPVGALIGQGASGGASGRIETAMVGGKLVYRATVGTFASYEAALAFCLKVEKAGRACWAR
jgi:hypothetical protein